MIWGSRVSLEIGFVATALALIVGTAAGGVAGYFGGAADTAVMRAADVFMSVPALFLILVIVALFGAEPAQHRPGHRARHLGPRGPHGARANA